MSPADRIRFARRIKGLSQAGLAALVGVQRSAVSHWESKTGKRPTATHLEALAQATDVNFEWLATGRGEPRIPPGILMDSMAAVDAILVEDEAEMSLVRSWRAMHPKARLALLEMSKLLVK